MSFRLPFSARESLLFLSLIAGMAAAAFLVAVDVRAADLTKSNAAFVRVSPRDPHYLELSDGSPYLPVGFNLVGAPASAELEPLVATMGKHGVNYCRVWLDLPPWNVEHQKSGQYDPAKAKELRRFLDLCQAQGIRVKLCIEWFRTILPEVSRPPVNGQFPKLLHHKRNGGPYENMKDFLTGEPGRTQFKGKLKWYAEQIGDHPAVFAWELWNEMNCVGELWYPWTKEMLPELHRLFPKNLAVQSLGSFDHDKYKTTMYEPLCRLADNDVLQVHRYLDLGARWPVCHGPVDILAADAVAQLRSFDVAKPILLAETGAVKPRHTGASELYALDKQGTLLHDMLFAPFFAGAAGPGHAWFWKQAIQTPNLWYHFERFQHAVAGIDPAAERLRPLAIEHSRLRVYVLRGQKTSLVWCRDRANDWKAELIDKQPPQRITGASLDLAPLAGAADTIASIDGYNPWTDQWSSVPRTGVQVVLPDFERSLVLRIRLR